MRWNPFTKWWLAWGAAFTVIELSAIRKRSKYPGGTLSSLVWRFSDRKNPIRRRLFLAGWLTLSLHFLLHWF